MTAENTPAGDQPRGVGDQRRVEISAALADVRDRISAACARAGRDLDDVRMLPVTKTFPASDAAILLDLGMTEFGENRDQEAAPKARELAELRPGRGPTWHLVGRLQRNKARSVVRWADVVQSVDSSRLTGALDRAVANGIAAGERTKPLEVLLQASLDDDPARGGYSLDQLPAAADEVTRTSGLVLRGVMAVAPLGADPRPAFERLARASEALRRDFPHATELSAGMSGDLEHAIEFGSTCVRVGTALLGTRRLASP